MGRLRSLLTVAVATIGLILCSFSSLQSSELTTDLKYEIIKEYVRADRSNKELSFDTFDRTTGYSHKVYTAEENTTGHDHFQWSWIRHFLTWSYIGLDDSNQGYFTFVAKDYQDFVTANSKGVLVMKIIDKNMDGKVDSYSRNYYIVINGDSIIMPDYPKGFIDEDFFTPTEAELDRFLQRELDYWMKMAGKNA